MQVFIIVCLLIAFVAAVKVIKVDLVHRRNRRIVDPAFTKMRASLKPPAKENL